MINFISVENGMIKLFDTRDVMVKMSSDPIELATAIVSCGGPASIIYNDYSCRNPTEYGFESKEAFDLLWDKVCSLI